MKKKVFFLLLSITVMRTSESSLEHESVETIPIKKTRVEPELVKTTPTKHENKAYSNKRVSNIKFSKKNKPSCKKTAESYEFALYQALSDRINWDHLLEYTISDFTNRKASSLNFFEAVGLYLYAYHA